MLDISKLGPLLTNLGIPKEHNTYFSNIGYIIVPIGGEFVFKLFLSKDIYQKELKMYELLFVEGVPTPKFWGLGAINDFFVLKLENVRKDFKRKDNMLDLDLSQVANILNTIHSIDPIRFLGVESHVGEHLIIGDVHSSNFYEKRTLESKIQLGIFDFSSAKSGEKEEDLANFYIDICLNDRILNEFLLWYGLKIEILKLYKYAFRELQERIKNGMNLKTERKKKYYTFMLILRDKLKTYRT